jgi:hypothetical protein
LLEIVSNVFIARELVPVRRKTGATIGGTLASVVTHAVATEKGVVDLRASSKAASRFREPDSSDVVGYSMSFRSFALLDLPAQFL